MTKIEVERGEKRETEESDDDSIISSISSNDGGRDSDSDKAAFSSSDLVGVTCVACLGYLRRGQDHGVREHVLDAGVGALGEVHVV